MLSAYLSSVLIDTNWVPLQINAVFKCINETICKGYEQPFCSNFYEGNSQFFQIYRTWHFFMDYDWKSHEFSNLLLVKICPTGLYVGVWNEMSNNDRILKQFIYLHVAQWETVQVLCLTYISHLW